MLLSRLDALCWQLDPRDLDHSFEGREHFKEIFSKTETSKFVVSLGDLGESKDCTGSGSLFAGTTECFKLARSYLDGYGEPFDVVGGNHDLEGIDEFFTDESNLEVYLKAPQQRESQPPSQIERLAQGSGGSPAPRTAAAAAPHCHWPPRARVHLFKPRAT